MWCELRQPFLVETGLGPAAFAAWTADMGLSDQRTLFQRLTLIHGLMSPAGIPASR